MQSIKCAAVSLLVDSSAQFLLKTGFDTNYMQSAEIARYF